MSPDPSWVDAGFRFLRAFLGMGVSRPSCRGSPPQLLQLPPKESPVHHVRVRSGDFLTPVMMAEQLRSILSSYSPSPLSWRREGNAHNEQPTRRLTTGNYGVMNAPVFYPQWQKGKKRCVLLEGDELQPVLINWSGCCCKQQHFLRIPHCQLRKLHLLQRSVQVSMTGAGRTGMQSSKLGERRHAGGVS